MTTMTIEVPENLAQRLAPMQDRMIEIIELGIRELAPNRNDHYIDVVDFLADGPSSAEIIELQASPDMQERIAELLDKNRDGTITEQEATELDRYEQLDYLITLIKARARQRLS